MHQPDDVVRDIGRKIAELRGKSGMTQEQAAERLGVTLKLYQRVERGVNATVRTLVRVAAMLDVEPIRLWEPPLSREVRRGRPPKPRPPPT